MAKKILVLDGKVVDVQEKEFPVAPGLTWHDCEDDSVKIGWSFSEGVVTEPIRVPNDWEGNRYIWYPPLRKQMDMMYWDEVNGTTTWKEAIAKVKSDFPKP